MVEERQDAPHDHEDDDRHSALWRNVGKWGVALALFLSLCALLISLLAFQLTAEGPAKRTLRRAIAATTEIDTLIERNYDDFQARAAELEDGDVIELRDYPISVPLTPGEARGISRDELRDVLLDRSADRVYDEGTGVLRDDEASGRVGRFTAAGVMRSSLGLLRDSVHDAFGVLTYVLAALCLVLAGMLAWACRGFGRMTSVGATLLLAATPLLLAGIGARFYMRIASDADTEYLERELLEIGQGLAWVPIRNGAAFTALGAVILVLGFALARWSDARTHSG